MTTTKLVMTTLMIAGLAGGPFAAEARKHKHYVSGPANYPTSGPYPTAGVTVPRSGTYGSSGAPIGTVTAPSVGTYSWPSVGVTNARPTWSNTSPPVR
jgi:hypothetical protein